MAKGQVIGYVRVSSDEQKPERQLEGIELDKVFIDRASGKDVKRPQLEALLNYVREGDKLIVHSMDRLARNLDDLRRLVDSLTAKFVQVQFIKENLILTGEDSPLSKLLLSIMGAFAEFERSLLRERQLEGIALAKKRGAYKGRKKCLTPEKVRVLKERIKNGEKKSTIARDFGVSRETLYHYLRATSAA
jgi:DNA invertase Pin-like site-specific DNA recombinase